MALQAIKAGVIKYTNTHNVYQTITETGKRILSKETRTLGLDHEEEIAATSQVYTHRPTLKKSLED